MRNCFKKMLGIAAAATMMLLVAMPGGKVKAVSSSIMTAEDLVFGQEIKETVIAEPAHMYYYKMELPSSGRVHFTVSTKITTDFAIYDHTGAKSVKYWDKMLPSSTGITYIDKEIDLLGGTYYVLVGAYYSGNTLPAFTLKATFESAEESFTEKTEGSDNTYDTARQIDLGETYKGQIAKNDTEDFYAFKLDSKKKIQVEMTCHNPVEYSTAYGKHRVGFELRNEDNKAISNFFWASDVTVRREEKELDPGNYFLYVDGNGMMCPYTFTIRDITETAKDDKSDSSNDNSSNNNSSSGSSNESKDDKNTNSAYAPKTPTKLAAKANKKGSKSIKITWAKQKSKTSGYQIQYSTDKKFKNAKTVTIKKNTTTSKTVKNLKKGKKYYVRIRAYNQVGKSKYYSGYSKSKTVKVK